MTFRGHESGKGFRYLLDYWLTPAILEIFEMKFPTFTPSDNGYVVIELAAGISLRFDPSQVRVPSDLVPESDPNYETFFAVYKWLQTVKGGIQLGQILTDQQLIAEYLATEFTPIAFGGLQ